MSAPLNMEEWQRRMKAEKEAARQKKNESSEILRGYRGELTDDDLKLKALREEERKRHQDAQQILHSYKGTQLQEGGSKPKEQQRHEQHYPTPVNVGNGATSRDLMEGIVSGSVSERAAAFAGSEPLASPTTCQQQRQSSSSAFVAGVATDDDEDDFGPAMAATEVSETLTQPVFSPMKDPLAAAPPIEEPIAVKPPTEDTFVVVSPQVEDPFVAVPPVEEPVVIEPPPVEEQTLFAAPQISTSIAPATTNGTARIPPVRVEVSFSFGLVTVQSQPDLTRYMAAVQSVVTKSLIGGTNVITYNRLLEPFVKELKWDASYVSRSGRSDVKRVVVTAVVPVFVASASSSSMAREAIVEALQASIQSGDFLLLAQGN